MNTKQKSLLDAAALVLTTNGGPIGDEETVNGDAYVMVRSDAFEALADAVGVVDVKGITENTTGVTCPDCGDTLVGFAGDDEDVRGAVKRLRRDHDDAIAAAEALRVAAQGALVCLEHLIQDGAIHRSDEPSAVMAAEEVSAALAALASSSGPTPATCRADAIIAGLRHDLRAGKEWGDGEWCRAIARFESELLAEAALDAKDGAR